MRRLSDPTLLSPLTPAGYLELVLRDRIRRTARHDRGASAIEWVVITALLVGIALAVATVLRFKILAKANSLNLDG